VHINFVCQVAGSPARECEGFQAGVSCRYPRTVSVLQARQHVADFQRNLNTKDRLDNGSLSPPSASGATDHGMLCGDWHCWVIFHLTRCVLLAVHHRTLAHSKIRARILDNQAPSLQVIRCKQQQQETKSEFKCRTNSIWGPIVLLPMRRVNCIPTDSDILAMLKQHIHPVERKSVETGIVRAQRCKVRVRISIFDFHKNLSHFR
jgi:hypothetical protein